jgi:2-polyprenyl-6-methoxyphenol hydroxylase-like FAD-dependent oxidoreductase
MERVVALAYEPFRVLKKYDGTLIGVFPEGPAGDNAFPINRSEFHEVLFNYTIEIGISVEFDTTVKEYYESSTAGGVILSDGRVLEADLTVAADGVGTTSWRLITGSQEGAISSGFALYRTSFPAGPALENPIIAKEFGDHKTYMGIYFGPDVHGVFGKTEKTMFWTLTHKVSYPALFFSQMDIWLTN